MQFIKKRPIRFATNYLITGILACAFSANTVLAQDTSNDIEGKGFLRYIDPRIGNVGQLLQPTRPTVQQPNQLIRMYPERKDYMDDQISSFPLTIVSHRLGEAFSLKPWSRAVNPDAWKENMTFDHDLEITRPWYYSTFLIDDGITVEFTAGRKAGIYRFSFPRGTSEKSLLFDLYNGGAGSWKYTGGNTLEGMETYHDDIKIYVYGKFSSAGKPGILKDGKLSPASETSGKGSRSFITFQQDSPDTISFSYAISFISTEQAKANFHEELDRNNFRSLRHEGEQAWEKAINNIQVEGGTEAQRRSFYTAYYRSNERMVDITEDGRYYSGFDKKIHQTARPFYTDDWTWDTYLALHPLRAIVDPARESDMANSYVEMYEQGGWMPTFPVLFGDHPCMNGFHSSIMLLDDYRKGIRAFDFNKAYEGMIKNATEATMLPWRNGPKTSLDDFYYSKGYFPALRVGQTESEPLVHPFEKRQAVAVTLGASYDDWAVGEMAEELGKTTESNSFHLRGANYKNLWNKNIGMFMPKDDAGNWINIDPKFDGGMGGRDYFDENNGWTYMWQVQEDVRGLIGLMGGKDLFEKKLDQLFREPLGRSKYEFWAKFPDATGNVGEYSMGNEPSFHIPYLYNFTNAPWKTQKHIRLLLDLWFKDNIFGVPGDEDGGGMSAFVVFSSMGFYPVTPGKPVYTIGSPLFSKITINLQNGKQFKVIAHNASVVNKYIQSAKMNGQTLNTPWFSHEQLINGGILELEMGPKPNKSWGID